MYRYAPTLLRMALGAVFVAHGAQKLFAVWGGPGLGGTASYVGSLGLSPAYPLALLLAVTEFGGGLLLILGALVRWVSLALAIAMAIAIWKVHLANGFFLNWTNAPGRGHGIEYNVVLMAGLLALALTGAGALSFDERLARSAEAEAAGRARLRAGGV